MKKIRDIVAVTGTYTKEGQEKNRYKNVGALIQDDEDPKRLAIAWKGLPVAAILHAAKQGKDTIWLSLFEPTEPGQQQPQPTPEQPATQPEADDDIPF